MENIEVPWWNGTSLSPAYVSAEITVGILAVIENTIVIASFVRVSNLRVHRNYYIISLAIADFFLGLVNIPLNIIVSIGLPKNLFGCLLSVSLIEVPLHGSLFSLLLITTDRLWAIAWPYSYQKRMRKTLALRLICGAWIFAFLFSSLPLMGWYNRDGWESAQRCFYRQVQTNYRLIFSHGITVFAALTIVLVVYLYMYRFVVKQVKRDKISIQHGRRFSSCSEVDVSCSIIHMKLLADSRYGVKVGKIVLIFMICQLPLASIFFIRAFFPQEIVIKIPVNLSTYALILLHANSAINPLLYAFHLSEFRSAMRNTCSAIFLRDSSFLRTIYNK